MEKKVIISRDDLKKNIMKNVSFLLEYDGAVGVESFISKNVNFFSCYFKESFSEQEQKIIVRLPNQKKISRSKQEGIVQVYWGFINGENIEEDVQLIIGKTNVNFEIGCKNYNKIDVYLNFIIKLIFLFKETDPFFQLKNFVINKKSFETYPSLDLVFGDFNRDILYPEKFSNSSFDTRIIREFQTIDYKKDEESFLLYYNRGIEKGETISSDETVPVYRAYLDFSGILNEKKIQELNWKDEKSITQTLESLNNALFDIFVLTMTKEFFEKNKKGV